MTAPDTSAAGPDPVGNPSAEPDAGPSVGVRIARGLALLAVLGLLFWAGRRVPVQPALDWVASLGLWGPVALVGVYLVACVALVPGSLLTLGAGALFGVGVGSVTVSVGATVGACAAFLVGRRLARDWVARRFVAGNARFAAVDRAVEREGFKIVLLTRLSPLFPFNMLNYAYGLTGVPFRDYALASWIGMLPGTVMYVSLGHLAGEVVTSVGGERERGAGETALLVLGAVATVVVTLLVTRLARRELDRQTDGDAVPAGASTTSPADEG